METEVDLATRTILDLDEDEDLRSTQVVEDDPIIAQDQARALSDADFSPKGARMARRHGFWAIPKN
jgi:hypothetical protein